MWQTHQQLHRAQRQQHQQQQRYGMAPQQTRPRTMQPVHLGGDEEDRAFQQQQQQQRLGNATPIDAPVHSSNPRASRNMAEKQRRDNLNTQIATMASLVPTVSGGGSRKKDKISVLRLTAAHLRIAYTLGLTTNEFLPRQFNDIDLENCLIDNLAGNSSFLLVVTTAGKIIYISRHVEQHLGHEQIDLIGDSLYNYVYRHDHEELTRGLTPEASRLAVTNTDSLEEASNSSEDSTPLPEYNNFREERRSFNIRMSQRTNSRRENVQYEYLQISGVLRLANECKNQETNNSRTKRDHSSTSNDIIFIGTARLLKQRSITELSILETNKNEYFTRHLVDGRIIFCDHRISIVAGYMSEEVSGTSAFKFMHKDDVRWTIVALRHMYDQGINHGSSCYRLITKTGEFIYLRTHGYLEYDETTQSVVSFICINTLTSPKEGEELIADMKKRFSATISSTTVRAIRGTDDGFESESDCSSGTNGGPNLEDASKLEDAITHLISDLPSPVINEDRQSPSPLPNAQLVKAAIYSHSLPPASLQASKIGIKDIENAWPFSGKRDKGIPTVATKKNTEESSLSRAEKNGERVKLVAEKRIPELDDSSSPVSTSRKSTPTSEKAFTSPNPSKSETYPEPVHIEETLEIPQQNTINTCGSASEISLPFDIETNIITDYLEPSIQPESNSQQINLKRPYDDEQDANDVSPKKRSVDNCLTLELVNVDNSISCVNGELNFPAYIQVQPMTLDTNLQEVQNNYQQFNTNIISVNTSENQFIDFQDFQDEQLLTSAIESNPEIIKLFTNLPPTLNLEEASEEPNVHQYPTSDQGAVVKNEVRRAQLQMADSISSCESQFSDIDESNIPVQCNNLTPEQPEHNIQKQQNLETLQLNVRHDIGV